jgi:hypothetical protein
MRGPRHRGTAMTGHPVAIPQANRPTVLVPTLFVRRGLRPSGVAPTETLTRLTWTLGSERISISEPRGGERRRRRNAQTRTLVL